MHKGVAIEEKLSKKDRMKVRKKSEAIYQSCHPKAKVKGLTFVEFRQRALPEIASALHVPEDQVESLVCQVGGSLMPLQGLEVFKGKEWEESAYARLSQPKSGQHRKMPSEPEGGTQKKPAKKKEAGKPHHMPLNDAEEEPLSATQA